MADKRLIDANALMEYFERLARSLANARCFSAADAVKGAAEKVSSAPTISAVPVVHGRWVRAAGKSNIWYCSVCGDKINYKQNRRTYNIQIVPVEQKNKFCRNCGAKMDGGSEG